MTPPAKPRVNPIAFSPTPPKNTTSNPPIPVADPANKLNKTGDTASIEPPSLASLKISDYLGFLKFYLSSN
jgi:hypothetical protein